MKTAEEPQGYLHCNARVVDEGADAAMETMRELMAMTRDPYVTEVREHATRRLQGVFRALGLAPFPGEDRA